MEKEILEKFLAIKKLIGKTPLVEITYSYLGCKQKAYAKLEWYNLTGSIKDRVAYQMLFDAFRKGVLNKNKTVVEVTSGNMGISLASLCNLLGIKCEIVMPETMSEERKKLIKLYGAKLTEVKDFLAGFDYANNLDKEKYFVTNQFENKSNYYAHYTTTGKEIFEKLKHKKVYGFVAGVGTSGTLTGAGKFLKRWKNCKVIGIEPKMAKILSGKKPFGKHKIQGLSDQKLPKLYENHLVDEIIAISDNDALLMSQKLCKKLSLGVGISSGANFLGCVLSKKPCATVFADDNKKYLSTDLTSKASGSIASKVKLIGVRVL